LRGVAAGVTETVPEHLTIVGDEPLVIQGNLSPYRFAVDEVVADWAGAEALERAA
jgi:hypothetical protein